MAATVHRAGTVCANCNREFGQGMACQFCSQLTGMPSGVRLSSVGRRFGAYLLDGLLAIVTLGIGWMIWSLIVWGQGYTPGKQLMKMKAVKLDTGESATWGTMFLREFVGKGIIGAIAIPITLGILAFMLLWDSKRQQVWDKVAGTVIVDGLAD
jgi:uncharacterized RDD family membrane protein YckC